MEKPEAITFTSEEERLQHPKASLIPKAIWHNIFSSRLTLKQQEYMEQDLDILISSAVQGDRTNGSSQSILFTAVLVSHRDNTPNDLLHFARVILKLSTKLIYIIASRCNHLGLLELISSELTSEQPEALYEMCCSAITDRAELEYENRLDVLVHHNQLQNNLLCRPEIYSCIEQCYQKSESKDAVKYATDTYLRDLFHNRNRSGLTDSSTLYGYYVLRYLIRQSANDQYHETLFNYIDPLLCIPNIKDLVVVGATQCLLPDEHGITINGKDVKAYRFTQKPNELLHLARKVGNIEIVNRLLNLPEVRGADENLAISKFYIFDRDDTLIDAENNLLAPDFLGQLFEDISEKNIPWAIASAGAVDLRSDPAYTELQRTVKGLTKPAYVEFNGGSTLTKLVTHTNEYIIFSDVPESLAPTTTLQAQIALDLVLKHTVSFNENIALPENMGRLRFDERAVVYCKFGNIEVGINIQKFQTNLEAYARDHYKLFMIFSALDQKERTVELNDSMAQLGIVSIIAPDNYIPLEAKNVCFLDDRPDVGCLISTAGFHAVPADTLPAERHYSTLNTYQEKISLSLKTKTDLLQLLRKEAKRVEGSRVYAIATLGSLNRLFGATQKSRQLYALANAIENSCETDVSVLLDKEFGKDELKRKGAIIPLRHIKESISARKVLEHHRHSITDWLFRRESKSQTALDDNLFRINR